MMSTQSVTKRDATTSAIFKRVGKARLGFAVILLAVMAAACQDLLTSTESGEEAPSRLVIVPENVIIVPNDSVEFIAVAFTQSGDTTDVDVVWSASGGTITPSARGGQPGSGNGGGGQGKRGGWYKNGKCGDYQVTATTVPGEISASASVRVSCTPPGPVATVTVTPEAATLQVGESVQLAVTLTDANGIRLTGRTTTWTPSDLSVASVDQNGLVSGEGEGSATITATSEGVSGTSTVTVEGSSPPPVASVEVTPASATLQIGQNLQLTRVLRDADGNQLSGRETVWTTSDAAVADVDGNGLVTAVSEGQATITATSEGVSGTAAITVLVSSGGGGNTAPNLKVAFIGDQGHGSDALAVLQLIKDEGTDMVLHQGDFDYSDDPALWDGNITSVLGADFPYFASVGNHDDNSFYGAGGYQEKLQQRLGRVSGATCTGDLGVNSACEYQGLFFILSGVGTLGSGHEAYIRDQLAANNSTWRVCSWHKNQNAMQVGGKGNDVGWGSYEACREFGAIIATGHEHSYSRTKTLTSTEQQTVDPSWSDPAILRVAPGATFAFVSGLAGASIRDQQRCLPSTYPYGCKGEWASIYTSNQGAQYGALFIEFNVDGDPNKARGYFKDIDGRVADEFTVTSQNSP